MTEMEIEDKFEFLECEDVVSVYLSREKALPGIGKRKRKVGLVKALMGKYSNPVKIGKKVK